MQVGLDHKVAMVHFGLVSRVNPAQIITPADHTRHALRYFDLGLPFWKGCLISADINLV